VFLGTRVLCALSQREPWHPRPMARELASAAVASPGLGGRRGESIRIHPNPWDTPPPGCSSLTAAGSEPL